MKYELRFVAFAHWTCFYFSLCFWVVCVTGICKLKPIKKTLKPKKKLFFLLKKLNFIQPWVFRAPTGLVLTRHFRCRPLGTKQHK